jgi:hypothetical protein
MINTGQLREYVIRAALRRLEPVIAYSEAAEVLVFGTGAVESNYTFLDQTTDGPGPAYGFWQMEKPTYEDIWTNFVPGVEGLRAKLLEIAGFDSLDHPPVVELHGNLFFAAAMCRVHYRRARASLPAADDAHAMAEYWKQHYNTVLGAGTVGKALPFFQKAITP